jgi:hypothetical protein
VSLTSRPLRHLKTVPSTSEDGPAPDTLLNGNEKDDRVFPGSSISVASHVTT